MLTRCKILKFCQQDKVDVGIYYLKSKRKLPTSVIERNTCLYVHKNLFFSAIWKKYRKDIFLNGVGEIERNFNFF